MTTSSIVLVGGGARSGKSRFAALRAQGFGPRRVFVATAEPRDDEEMIDRIARHRSERGDAFETLEAPRALPETLAALSPDDVDVVLVDCLTLWIANLLLDGVGESDVLARTDAVVDVVRRRGLNAVLVTNEVGMGLVPDTPLGRVFRDVTGRVHQRIAAVADEVHFAALGVILRLHPPPLAAMVPGRSP